MNYILNLIQRSRGRGLGVAYTNFKRTDCIEWGVFYNVPPGTYMEMVLDEKNKYYQQRITPNTYIKVDYFKNSYQIHALNDIDKYSNVSSPILLSDITMNYNK